MALELTQAEADAKIEQIVSAKEAARQKLANIADAQQQMLSRAWQGDAAGNYQRVSQQLDEEFQQLIAALQNVVDKGSEHIKSVVSGDQG